MGSHDTPHPQTSQKKQQFLHIFDSFWMLSRALTGNLSAQTLQLHIVKHHVSKCRQSEPLAASSDFLAPRLCCCCLLLETPRLLAAGNSQSTLGHTETPEQNTNHLAAAREGVRSCCPRPHAFVAENEGWDEGKSECDWTGDRRASEGRGMRVPQSPPKGFGGTGTRPKEPSVQFLHDRRAENPRDPVRQRQHLGGGADLP